MNLQKPPLCFRKGTLSQLPIDNTALVAQAPGTLRRPKPLAQFARKGGGGAGAGVQ